MSGGESDGGRSVRAGVILNIIGVFALVGVGVGLTGGVATTQLGSGSAILSGILVLVVLVVAFLLGPVVGVVTGLRTGDEHGRTSQAYLGGLVGSVAGYFVMMLVVVLALSVAMSVATGGGGAAESTQSAASTESAGGGFAVGDYLVPILAVAVPTGLTGAGGVFLGGASAGESAQGATGGSLDVPWRYVGVGVVVVAVLAAGVVVGPSVLSAESDAASSGPQLVVTGDASTTQDALYAEGSISNPTDSRISNDLVVELVIDGEVVTTAETTVSVVGNNEESFRLRVATAEELSRDEIRAIQNGAYQLRYVVAGETVETYEA